MAEPLKNVYNQVFFDCLSQELITVYPAFDKTDFINQLFDNDWDVRELKQRMRHIANCLHKQLPGDYEQSLEILKAVPSRFEGYKYMFFPDYVEVYGLDNWDTSLSALEHFTIYASSEFAVRPFIKQDQNRMMKQMRGWAKHENHHVRRLASEGCRPRLPWAMSLPAFKKNPEPILPILEILKNDSHDYVRRSVANNLNDITKDHPELVLELARKWQNHSPETDWVIKHGCRTLLKNGHPDALALFGFYAPSDISMSKLRIESKSLKIGGNFSFSFEIQSKNGSLGKLRLEYGIYYQKANGTLSRKVFKISESDYRETRKTFSQKRSFKNFTTRKHYPGKHQFSVIVNGHELAKVDFLLEV